MRCLPLHRILLHNAQLPSRKLEVELTTLSSAYHLELNPADVGTNDRYVVQVGRGAGRETAARQSSWKQVLGCGVGGKRTGTWCRWGLECRVLAGAAMQVVPVIWGAGAVVDRMCLSVGGPCSYAQLMPRRVLRPSQEIIKDMARSRPLGVDGSKGFKVRTGREGGRRAGAGLGHPCICAGARRTGGCALAGASPWQTQSQAVGRRKGPAKGHCAG